MAPRKRARSSSAGVSGGGRLPRITLPMVVCLEAGSRVRVPIVVVPDGPIVCGLADLSRVSGVGSSGTVGPSQVQVAPGEVLTEEGVSCAGEPGPSQERVVLGEEETREAGAAKAVRRTLERARAVFGEDTPSFVKWAGVADLQTSPKPGRPVVEAGHFSAGGVIGVSTEEGVAGPSQERVAPVEDTKGSALPFYRDTLFLCRVTCPSCQHSFC